MKPNPEFAKKLEQEDALLMSESHELDQFLSASEVVRGPLRDLNDDEPSMAWRSGLNEKLLALHAPKRSLARVWGLTGFGTAVAVAASIFVLTKPSSDIATNPVTGSKTSPEQIMVDAHRMNVFALSTGAGDGSEPIQSSNPEATHQWTEADLGSF